MRKHLVVLAVLAASLVAGTASANTITAQPAGSITAASLGRLTFTGRGSIEISVSCAVSLRGSLNRTINNAASGSVGSLTEGRASECSMGRPTLLVEARSSWSLTLAETTRLEVAQKKMTVNIGSAKFQLAEIFGQTCLYEGTIGTTLEGEGEGERVFTRLERINSNTLRRVSGSALCPTTVEVRGEFSFTAQTLALRALSMTGTLNPTDFELMQQEKLIRWENTGAKIVNADRITITSTDEPDLRIISNPCDGTEINPGGLCSVRVRLVMNAVLNRRLEVKDRDGTIIGSVTMIP